MTNLLDDRERAAENLFAHNEEMLFLAHKAGVTGFATWAAETIGLDQAASESYAAALLDACVGGWHDDQLVARVRADLEQAGRADVSGTAATVFAQKVAAATDMLLGHTPQRPPVQRHTLHATHPLGATLSWRD